MLSTSDSPASNKVHDDVNSTVINCETGLSVPVRLIHVNLVRAVAAMANSTFRHQKQRPTAAAAANHSTLENVRYAFEQFNEKTADMLTASSLIDMLPDQASYIVGHAPVSAAAALTLRKAMYPNSKVKHHQQLS